MKKHILSKYATRENEMSTVNGPTVITRAVESSDTDEFSANGPTKLTFTIEATDEDEMII